MEYSPELIEVDYPKLVRELSEENVRLRLQAAEQDKRIERLDHLARETIATLQCIASQSIDKKYDLLSRPAFYKTVVLAREVLKVLKLGGDV